MLVYLNGEFVDEEEAKVSILDRSYLYGEGLMETMKATRGFVPFLSEHSQRLFQGMKVLKIKFSLSISQLETAVYQTLERNQHGEAYLRITLSRLNQNLGSFLPSEGTNLLIVARPLSSFGELYEKGCSGNIIESVKLVPDGLSEMKSTNYLRNLFAQQLAVEAVADEALLTNSEGHLLEAARANLFLFDGDKWIIPPLQAGILPGITRKIVLELMAENKLEWTEGFFKQEDLLKIKETFLTNSIKGVFPLTVINGKKVGQGQVGQQTKRIMEIYNEEIESRRPSSSSPSENSI